MTTDTIVRARIPVETKDKAMSALRQMGLNASDLIRMVFVRVAEEGRVPFAVEIPNATTRAAIAELEAGNGKKFATIDDLMADLNADD